MKECRIGKCEICEDFNKHLKSYAHLNFLEKAIIDKYVEKNIDVERLKDILNNRIKNHVKIFTDFTIIFCWKVNNIEYSIIIIRDQVPSTVLGLEPLDRIIKRMFRQINIDNFEEFNLIFVSDIKKITLNYYLNQPMPMIQRVMSRRFSERIRNCFYHWLPDCVLYPKFNHISRCRGPRKGGVKSNYLEIPTM